MEVNEPLRLKGGQGDDELTRRHVTNYLRNVSKKNANSYFKLPWGGGYRMRPGVGEQMGLRVTM